MSFEVRRAEGEQKINWGKKSKKGWRDWECIDRFRLIIKSLDDDGDRFEKIFKTISLDNTGTDDDGDDDEDDEHDSWWSY